MIEEKTEKTTKVLFVEEDEVSFQFRKCMASIIEDLPPLELFHANDATEALSILEQLEMDVVVLDHEDSGEHELFLDSLGRIHPPVLVHTEETKKIGKTNANQSIRHMPKIESLDQIHQSLMMIAEMGTKSVEEVKNKNSIH